MSNINLFIEESTERYIGHRLLERKKQNTNWMPWFTTFKTQRNLRIWNKEKKTNKYEKSPKKKKGLKYSQGLERDESHNGRPWENLIVPRGPHKMQHAKVSVSFPPPTDAKAQNRERTYLSTKWVSLHRSYWIKNKISSQEQNLISSLMWIYWKEGSDGYCKDSVFGFNEILKISNG